MKNIRSFFALSMLVCSLAGCHSSTTQTAAPEPEATNTQPATNANPDPNNRDCNAIKDPAQQEDCRLWKSVAAARKKHDSDPVVKHSPGSIKQP